MLSPCDKVLPGGDVVPHIWKAVSPSSKEQLELARFDVKIGLISLCQTLTDHTSVMKLDELLEVL